MQHKTFKQQFPFIISLFFLIFLKAHFLYATPFIQITSPTNGTTYIEGDTVILISDAGNPGGLVTAVEFYVNNVYIGTDSTAPYRFHWIATMGTHLLTTRAVIGHCKDVTSLPVQIGVKKNHAPLVHLTEPTPSNHYFSSIPVPIAAIATDSDGVISQVDFFVNDVLVNSDATPPYAFNWKSQPGDYTVFAKAKDNKGAEAISTPVAITIYPPIDAPPTASLTSPNDGDHFLLGTPVHITANATDADGTVSFVEFFVNGNSIGIDDTAPYEINWPGGAGISSISARATDNVCVSKSSDTIHISVLDPNAPPYLIETISGPCTDTAFCLPVKAVMPVKDIIGYDLVLHYDKNKVHPTGTVIMSNDLIQTGYVSLIANNIDSLSELHISVFLNNSAPSTAAFKGLGQLLCIEFKKRASFAAKDSALFTITELQESYANGVQIKQATPGKYINLKNTFYKGTLQFWADNSPIAYNAASPSQYLVTNIYGSNSNCSNLSANAIQPDLNGKFTYNIGNGPSMQIKRDISPAADVQPVINGMDVSLGYAVVLNDLSFIPNIYQAIALDVNMDGVISAGDLSQMNQRSIKTILEFKQKWNYNNNGNSNGQLSKDWLFVDEALLANPAYKISAAYPASDGIGFSKYKVPAVPFCLPVPSSVCSSCTAYAEGRLKGILLGDVNGNYVTIPADGQIKREGAAAIWLDVTKAKQGKNYIEVPVFFRSTETIRALDLSIRLNESIHYSGLLHPAGYLTDALANVDDEQVLRFTSNGKRNYESDKPVISIRFETTIDSFDENELLERTGYLNGEPVPFEIHNYPYPATRILHPGETSDLQIYPNPTNGILNILSDEQATLQLLDMQGKELILERPVSKNEKLELPTNPLKPGTYLLKLFNERSVRTERIVVERK